MGEWRYEVSWTLWAVCTLECLLSWMNTLFHIQFEVHFDVHTTSHPSLRMSAMLTIPEIFTQFWQTWDGSATKFPEMVKNSWKFQKLSQNYMKIEEFVKVHCINFLKSGIFWRNLMPGIWHKLMRLVDVDWINNIYLLHYIRE